MRFDTYLPCNRLQPYVKSIAIQEIPAEKTYRVLPDTGAVIGFQYKGRLSYLDHQKELPLSTAGITGIQDRYRVFKSAANTGTVLVFFREAGASAFLGQSLYAIFQQSVSMDNFIQRSELLRIEEQLSVAYDDTERIALIEKFLLSRLVPTQPDVLVIAALALIHKNRGTMRIRELAKQLYISQSSLEKRFRQSVGTSPKKFTSLVRLRHILQNYHPTNSLTSLGYEAGFYDQAHFIKDFRTFTGETPEIFFRRNNKNDFLQL